MGGNAQGHRFPAYQGTTPRKTTTSRVVRGLAPCLVVGGLGSKDWGPFWCQEEDILGFDSFGSTLLVNRLNRPLDLAANM